MRASWREFMAEFWPARSAALRPESVAITQKCTPNQ